MHTIMKSAVVFGALALAGAALAQDRAPPPGAQPGAQPGQQGAQPPPQRPPRRAPQPYKPQPAVTASFAGRNANFTGVVDPASGQLCYLLNVASIPGASTATIVSDKGQPAVTLAPPMDGSSGTCATIGADTAKALLDHPERYWLQIANATYPQGAASAQLHSQTYE